MYFMAKSGSVLAKRNVNGLYPKSANLEFPEDFSEVSRATVEDLLGGESCGPSYSALYYTIPGKSEQMDAARAMSHVKSTGNLEGYFDLITVRIFDGIFQRFAAAGQMKTSRFRDSSLFEKPEPAVFALSGKSKVKGAPRKEFLFSELQGFYLAPYLSPRDNSQLSLDFQLLTVAATVELRLISSDIGDAYWSLRGASALKKSHVALRDQLQNATNDFHSRLKWVEEYEGTKHRPAFDFDDAQEVIRNLDRICEVGQNPVALRTGAVFADDSLPLIATNGRVEFDRCLDCDVAVMLSADYEGPASVELQDLIAEVCYEVGKYLQGIHSHSGCPGLLATCSQTGVSFSVIG